MFLPDNYEAPKTANEGYMKLQDGENRIRILSQPIIGWEDWSLEKKPIRYKYDQKPERPIVENKPVRHFWAMIVWNYNEKKIQILQISQATLRRNLEKLCKDSDWGAPYFYDIKITKEGEGKDTEYSMNPTSHKPVSPQVMDEFRENPCNLEALFDNGDPFSREWSRHTPGVFSKDEPKIVDIKKNKISKEQAEELAIILEQCDQKYKETVWDSLHKSNIVALVDLPMDMYDRLFKSATKKLDESKNKDLPF